MIYVSIDIETTGLNPEKHQIIEFAAVLEDTDVDCPLDELRCFSTLVSHQDYVWNSEAYQMNKDLFGLINEKKSSTVNYDRLYNNFKDFLQWNGIYSPIPVAGKNFAAFDKQFLDKLPTGQPKPELKFSSLFSRRFLDPAILYIDWKNDIDVPNLSTCLKRAGLDGNVSHRALDDARQVISLLRKKI